MKAGIVEPSTLEMYEGHWRNHLEPLLGDVRLRDLSVGLVEDRLVAGWPASPSTLRKVLVCLGGICKAAHKRGLMPALDLTSLDLPRGRREPIEAFTLADVERVAECCDDWYAADVVFLAVTGLRMGEYAALRDDDVDVKAGVVRVRQVRVRSGQVRAYPKTDSSLRDVRLFGKALEAVRGKRAQKLEQGLAASPWMFPTPRGEMVHPSNWHARAWTPALQNAGMSHRKPHTLRHTAASLMIAADLPVLFVSRQLGHKSVVTTMGVYAHWLRGAEPEMVARFDSYAEAQG